MPESKMPTDGKYRQLDPSMTWIGDETVRTINQDKSLCWLCEHGWARTGQFDSIAWCKAHKDTKFDYVHGTSKKWKTCEEMNPFGECMRFELSKRMSIR